MITGVKHAYVGVAIEHEQGLFQWLICLQHVIHQQGLMYEAGG